MAIEELVAQLEVPNSDPVMPEDTLREPVIVEFPNISKDPDNCEDPVIIAPPWSTIRPFLIIN